MSTTLETELLQAAEVLSDMHCDCAYFRKPCEHEPFIARLRQRAAWVRELEQRWALAPHGYRDAFAALAGPDIPAETATSERKEP